MFDSATRNLLLRLVNKARLLLSEDCLDQFQEKYGIRPNGETAELTKLGHLSPVELAKAKTLRERLAHLVAQDPNADAGAPARAVSRAVREQAFTILNRFAALRMAESRGLVQECLAQGLQSKGFRLYDSIANTALPAAPDRYALYLNCLFDELALDLGVVFDRFSPLGLLFPSESSLNELIPLLNAPEVRELWAEDETIGWIYQYYNDPAERKKMRDESAAPRNSRELAVRNQFFTPRYVVEFLTDNTLGRIWYEMTRGATQLKDDCRYLVRRPTEIFLSPGENAPAQLVQDDLSQEELLRQPVHVPHRPLKDPRAIRMIDPACGSMHFGLYAFDLFERIYDEAWDLAERMKDEGKSMKELEVAYPEFSSFIIHTSSFASKEAFLREVPRLIIEANIHGVDIDPRAAQIAALALWLRAQKSWQRLGLKASERPAITRSNVVCAEPMPGEKHLLADFIAQEFPPHEQGVFKRFLETIFDKMLLAGEAGSLLKIEEEISSAVEEARNAWTKLQKPQLELFSAAEMNALRKQPQLELNAELRHLSADFFVNAEERIYAALQHYSEQAEGAGSHQRRLFAEDAARGFAFIDVCRKRYDVALMNPPFGEWAVQFKAQSRKIYPNSYNDILGAFVERGGNLLHLGGRLGAITSRTCFFLSSFSKWRDNVVLDCLRPEFLLDLGHGVMDAAMVEAAAYVLEKSINNTSDLNFRSHLLCIRMLNESLPEKIVNSVLNKIHEGRPETNVFIVNSSSFKHIPNSPFAYWVSERVLRRFVELPAFEGPDRSVRVGLQTSDDFRFLRTSWETHSAMNINSLTPRKWFPFAKGGSYSPFYADIFLNVNWRDNGKEIRFYGDSTGVKPFSRPQNIDFYFRAGLFQTLRAARLAPHLTPPGCIFGNNGFQAFSPDADLLPLLALINSHPVEALYKLQLGRHGFALFIPGSLQNTPIPKLDFDTRKKLSDYAFKSWKLKQELRTVNITSNVFFIPVLMLKKDLPSNNIKAWDMKSKNTEETLGNIQNEINEIAYRAYNIDGRDRHTIDQLFNCESTRTQEESSAEYHDSEVESYDPCALLDEVNLVSEAIDYTIGLIYGRWDIRYATGERQAPELPDPFAPLPDCPPGMLQNAAGLPVTPEDLPTDYPVKFPWNGILVDDPNHPLDLEQRVRSCLELIWKERAPAIEQEACDLLGMRSLRDYFRKPGAFFADHLKRYSKSRRQAPIYWPLSTPSGSYTLWIYYHRLDDQTLFHCLNIVQSKLEELEREIKRLEQDVNAGKTLTTRRDLLAELRDFHALIKEWAPKWKPNLNDGVLITAAPLWKLFRLPKWRKDLETCWKELEKGDYDWAHLSLTLWPERVRAKCVSDRSLAIAHDLEEFCTLTAPAPKAKKPKKGATPIEDSDIDDTLTLELPESPASAPPAKAPRAAKAAALSADAFLAPALDFLRQRGILTNTELQDHLKLDAPTSRNLLQSLVTAGHARIEGQKRGTRYIHNL